MPGLFLQMLYKMVDLYKNVILEAREGFSGTTDDCDSTLMRHTRVCQKGPDSRPDLPPGQGQVGGGHSGQVIRKEGAVTPKHRSKFVSVSQPCWRKCGAVNVDRHYSVLGGCALDFGKHPGLRST